MKEHDLIMTQRQTFQLIDDCDPEEVLNRITIADRFGEHTHAVHGHVLAVTPNIDKNAADVASFVHAIVGDAIKPEENDLH